MTGTPAFSEFFASDELRETQRYQAKAKSEVIYQ
jgi:hypothetical protein